MTSENFFGSVNNQWKKAKLEELAQAFALAPRPRTVAQLVHDIKAHMGKHPELSEVPKFQGLYVYRSANKVSQKQVKKSSDKALEDSQEALKGPGNVSGYVSLYFSCHNNNIIA